MSPRPLQQADSLRCPVFAEAGDQLTLEGQHRNLRSRAANARCSASQVSVSRVITDGDSPAEEPRNCPSVGTKSPLDSPCRYSSGSTSVIFGVLRAHGGKIAEQNRFRSPVAGSVR